MDTVKEIFSRNLRRLLERDGLKPLHLAQRLGIAASVVKRWADGDVIPVTTMMDRLRRELNWSLADLYAEDPSEYSKHKTVVITLDDAIRVINQQSDNIKVKLSRRG